MLHEDRIHLVHKIAQYEKSAEEYERPTKEYFCGDYLSMHLLQSFFSYMLSYLLILGVSLLYFLERILNTVSVSIVPRFVLRCIVIYAVGLLLFELVTYFAFRRRYEESTTRREGHPRRLKCLKKRYDTEERIKEPEKEESANV